jgi:DNA-binding response OmpR family regulator
VTLVTLERRRQTDGSRILLVEDNDALRSLMRVALETAGYRVNAVGSAEDGLHVMEVERFDLLLTDYSLPGETGAWLLRKATERRLLPADAALLATSQPDAPGINAGTKVIQKPVNFDELLPQIRAILGQAAQHAPEHATQFRRADPTDAAVELVLYVSPHSLPCRRAVRVMRDLVSRYDDRHVRFEVRDMAADSAYAAEDRIVFTPTLVKRSPQPGVWVLGDLSRPDVVIDLLPMCGIEPVGPIR